MAVIGESLVVFKTTCLFRLTGTDPSNFMIQKTSSTTGTSAPDSIAVAESYCYFLGRDGIYRFDGMQCALMSKRIQKTIDMVDPENIASAQGVYYNHKYLLAVTLRTNINLVQWKDFDSLDDGSVWTTSCVKLYAAGTGPSRYRTDQAEMEPAATAPGDTVVANLKLNSRLDLRSLQERFYIAYATVRLADKAVNSTVYKDVRLNLYFTDGVSSRTVHASVYGEDAGNKTCRQMLRLRGKEMYDFFSGYDSPDNIIRLGIGFPEGTAGADKKIVVSEMSFREVTEWDFNHLSDQEMHLKYSFFMGRMNRTTAIIIYDELQDAFFVQQGYGVRQWLGYFGHLYFADYSPIIKEYGVGNMWCTSLNCSLTDPGFSQVLSLPQYAYWRTPETTLGAPGSRKRVLSVSGMMEGDKELVVQTYAGDSVSETACPVSPVRRPGKARLKGRGNKLSFRLILSGHYASLPQYLWPAAPVSEPAARTGLSSPVIRYETDPE